jgi:hypothetical protein
MRRFCPTNMRYPVGLRAIPDHKGLYEKGQREYPDYREKERTR